MPTQSVLLTSLKTVQDEIMRLAGSLNEHERNTSGSPEQWETRDILAHLGQNNRYLAVDLAAVQHGETPPQGDVPERSNQAVFEIYRSRPWEDIQQLVEQSYTELVEQIKAFSDEDLNNPDQFAWLNGAPLWRRTAGLCIIHATVHLAQNYIARGDLDSGRRIATLERDLGLLIDDSDRWLGMVYYNQGCYHALLGEKNMALQELEKGFRLSPQFVDFAQQDPDLVSLQGDADFQEVQNRVKPAA